MALSRTFNLLGALVAAIVLSLAVIGCSFEREPEQGPEEPEFTVGTDSDDLDDAVKAIRSVTDFQPRVGIVLGSGLSGLIDHVDIVATVPYSDIAGFPVVGINCITNVATLDHGTVTSHEEVKDAAQQSSDEMIALVTATVVRIGAEG